MNNYKEFPNTKFIKTKDNRIVIGQVYLYKEEHFVTKVIVRDIREQKSTWYLKVSHEITAKNEQGKDEKVEKELIITFSTQTLNTEYDGVWQLSDL